MVLSRSLVRSLVLSLRETATSIDPDAQAYIDAVTSAKGSSPSLLQTVAIDTFYKAEKAAGRYSKLKRLYFPIWANVAANAVDMISLTSGTFIGSVAHESGYFRSTGGRLQDSANLSTLIPSAYDASVFVLIAQDGANINGHLYGHSPSGLAAVDGYSTTANLRSGISGFATDDLAFTNSENITTKKIVHAIRRSSTSLVLRKYTTGGGGVQIATNTKPQTLPTFGASRLTFSARDSGILATNTPMGACGHGLSMTDSQSNGFCASLQTLWDNCTTVDTDAAAYIAAVESALGSSITATQASAINTFYKAEKAAGRYSTHKRLYLPIWANAAANAIDIITLTSGTFSGTVTHGSGFVQGDGSTGSFLSNINMRTTFTAAAGGDPSVGSMSVLCYKEDTRNTRAVYWGASNVSDQGVIEQLDNSVSSGRTFSPSVQIANPRTGAFFACSRTGKNDRFYQRLTSAGLSTTRSTVLNGVYAPSSAPRLMARNNNGTADLHHNGRFGAAGVSLEMTEAEGADYLSNLKTLWETCTGLTLP
jgi:hypothetical protein